jgi:hypothetical protein
MTSETLNRALSYLMLQVILGKDPETQSALAKEWDERVMIDDMDYGVVKLVPLYLQKLKDLRYTSSHEKRLKVLHKYWWLRTLKNLDRLKEVVLTLTNSGKEVMLIKGIPVLPFYEGPVYRPMADVDILVKPNEVLNALAILEVNGWKSTDLGFLKRLRRFPSLCMDFKHSIELEHPQERTKMDLHWKVGNYASWELTHQVWASAIPSAEFSPASFPDLAHLLSMAILHSVDSESKHHYNWILDIAQLSPHLTPQIWQQAQQLAESEGKRNWFDYGCFILNQFGIQTPLELSATTPPMGRLPKSEFGSRLNFPRYILKKIENNFTILRINFPHDQGLKKVYRMMRRMAYFGLNRAG